MTKESWLDAKARVGDMERKLREARAAEVAAWESWQGLKPDVTILQEVSQRSKAVLGVYVSPHGTLYGNRDFVFVFKLKKDGTPSAQRTTFYNWEIAGEWKAEGQTDD